MKQPWKYLGLVYFVAFLFLILGGVALKRIWDLPQYMMLFHLPAAVFLVMAGMEMKRKRQADYDSEIAAVRERLGDPAASRDWRE